MAKKATRPVKDGEAFNIKSASRVARPKVNRPPCPQSAKHKNTRVVRTRGRKRTCICNDCGFQWDLRGEFSDDLSEYCYTVTQSLRHAKRVKVDDNGEVIVMDDSLATEIADQLEALTNHGGS